MSYESAENSGKRSPSLLLWVAAMCALFSSMSLGTVFGWSSSGLPSMANEGSHPHLTNTTEDEFTKSWIGSSTTLGALVGALLGGQLLGYFGMRLGLIGLGAPLIIGWSCILFTKIVPLMMVGRVLTGFGAGIGCGLAPTYCNHISTPSTRGLLGTGFQIFFTLGVLYMNLFGIGVTWRWLCIPGVLPAILMSVGMFFMPESPIWLMNKHGPSSKVEDALRRLRSSDSDVEEELKEIQDRIETERATSTKFSLAQLKRSDVYMPLIIANALMIFQQFSGMNGVLFYMADIFKSAGSKINPNINAVIVTSTMLIAVIISGFIIDKLGRKILLLISGSGHTISLVLMGYYFFNAHKECPCGEFVCPSTNSSIGTTLATTISYTVGNVTTLGTTVGTSAGTTIGTSLGTTGMPVLESCTASLGWLPVVSLIFYVIIFSIGFGPIPWMMTAEITPGYALGFISSVATGANFLCAFIVTLTFNKLQDPSVLNKHGTFWLFAAICAASVVFTAIVIPESKGKSQEEMSRVFLRQKDVKQTDG